MENAVEHGVRAVENGRIEVVFALSGSELILTVTDNGRGIQENSKEHRSMALKITRERLHMQGNNADSLLIESPVPEMGCGTRVRLVVPCKFTTGDGFPVSTLDFKKSEYTHKATQQLGFVKFTIPCMSDLIAQRTYYTHRFSSQVTFTESGLDFTVQQYTDECLYETPSSFKSTPYVSADTTALVLWQATEYSLYPYSQKKAKIDFTGFPSGARITDVVARVSANAFEGLGNELFVRAYYADQTVRTMKLKGTDGSGFFDYEPNTYGNKYYYREIHFPVLPGEHIDSLVVERDRHPVVKLMRVQYYFEVTEKPVVNLGPDRT